MFRTTRSQTRRHKLASLTMMLGLLVCLPATVTSQTEGSLAGRVVRLERALDSEGLVDLLQQLELLQAELRQLRGEMENQSFALEMVRKSQREAYADVDRRLGLIESGGIAATVAASPGVATDPPLPTLTTPAGVVIAGTPSTQAIAVDIRPPAAAAVALGADLTDAGTVAPGDTDELPPDGAAATADVSGDIASMDSTQPPVSTSPIINAPTPSIVPPTPTVDSAESEAAYRAAFTMLQGGQYDESIALFNNFLQQYPSSQYADNAQYWLGEAYFVMGQFEPAIDQYQKLVNGYPDSKKQSHAMLKIAYSYHELALAEQAVGVLTDLKNRFPGSAAARLADERMKRIRAESP
ncbi:MAG: tol-pal system protein YbgF [Gammaproteobacteria bacterium]|nr:tol-pal system protein YbgF [Gammaproteobacteria bacterium]